MASQHESGEPMILTEKVSAVHESGMAVRRVLVRAVDVWGKVVWFDLERWLKGREMLKAYKIDGEPLWVKGRQYLEAQVYCRGNIKTCEVSL